MSKSSNRELFTVRAAVILLISAFAGIVVGELTFTAGQSTAAALLAGLSGGASALVGAHLLIGHEL